MTTTDVAMPALPAPRRTQQVVFLPGADHQRRPAGQHVTPDEQLLDDDAHWEAESEACFLGRVHQRPLEQHGRRCACGCRPVEHRTEAAS